MYVISYLITCLYSFIICLKLEVSFKYSFSIAYYADILKKAFDFFSTQFIQQAFNWVTLLITAYLISEIDTGGINIIVKYISLTSLFLLVTNAYKGPEYTYLFAEGEIKKLNQSISSNTRFIVLCSTPLIIIMMIFPSFFLGLFSIKYVHLSNVFLVMLIGTLVNTFCGSVGMLMQMTQQQTRFRNIMFIALLLHIILSFILSKGYGVLGLGVSLAIVMIYWNIHSSIILQRKHGVISYFKF
ncbi:lipopolysaccharide biosynthesis protein [Patiriisocius hiemis]|uniref:Polysaccharide biosynthesis protein C-terminal domain-containing protein n=1 Tax=Patiriisocius hiemis TaxID=3075604 RepID=A0ABU2YEM0_9FLAO|nr:hypothetical protein [Constantimarinum sp. W242]MDT0556640.1 hypothetical protein [Constantimarinum sp. W242]